MNCRPSTLVSWPTPRCTPSLTRPTVQGGDRVGTRAAVLRARNTAMNAQALAPEDPEVAAARAAARCDGPGAQML